MANNKYEDIVKQGLRLILNELEKEPVGKHGHTCDNTIDQALYELNRLLREKEDLLFYRSNAVFALRGALGEDDQDTKKKRTKSAS